MVFQRQGIALFLAFFLLFSNYVSADSTGDWRLSIEGNMFSIDNSIRASEGLGQSGGGLDLGVVYYFAPKMAAKLGFGFVAFTDDQKFSQQVVSNFGDRDRFSSGVSAANFFGELLYQAPMKDQSNFGYRASLGYSLFAEAERSIDRCVDCRVDALDIEGGPYLSAGLFFKYSRKGKIGLSARQYLSDDINNGLVLWWESLGRD